MFFKYYLLYGVLIFLLFIKPVYAIDNSKSQLTQKFTRALKKGDNAFKARRYSRALIQYNKAIKLINNNYLAYYKRGLAFASWGDDQNAIVDFSNSLNLKPNYPDAYLNRGYAYSRRFNHNLAISDFKSYIKYNKTNANVFFALGSAYYSLNRYKLAIDEYNEAIQLNNNNQKVYYSRALALYALKDYKKAVQDLTKVVRSQPNNIQAYYFRAMSFFNLRAYNYAIKDFNKVLSKNNKAEIYRIRGDAYYKIKKFSQARQDYASAIKLKPKNADNFFQRAKTNYYLKANERASLDFEQAVRIDRKYIVKYCNSKFSKVIRTRINCKNI